MNNFIHNDINDVNSKIDQNTKSFKNEYVNERLKYFNEMLKTARMVDVEGTSKNTPINFYLNIGILENYFLNNSISKLFVTMLRLNKYTDIDSLSTEQCNRLYKFLEEVKKDLSTYKKNVVYMENIVDKLFMEAKTKWKKGK